MANGAMQGLGGGGQQEAVAPGQPEISAEEENEIFDAMEMLLPGLDKFHQFLDESGNAVQTAEDYLFAGSVYLQQTGFFDQVTAGQENPVSGGGGQQPPAAVPPAQGQPVGV